MTAGTNSVPSSPEELLGDVHPLLDQLGSAEDLAVTSTVADTIDLRRVSDLPSLRDFLQSYRSQVLAPIELPAIVSAFNHSARGELKGVLHIDKELAQNMTLRKFAPASCRVGQRQLSKLRPMRDQRLVQRYLAAIENGQARGWHTLVYGVSLAMFSLPLRQGLQNYIEKTVRGFIYSSAKSLRLSEADCQSMDAEQQLYLPPAIDLALKDSSFPC